MGACCASCEISGGSCGGAAPSCGPSGCAVPARVAAPMPAPSGMVARAMSAPTLGFARAAGVTRNGVPAMPSYTWQPPAPSGAALPGYVFDALPSEWLALSPGARLEYFLASNPLYRNDLKSARAVVESLTAAARARVAPSGGVAPSGLTAAELGQTFVGGPGATTTSPTSSDLEMARLDAAERQRERENAAARERQTQAAQTANAVITAVRDITTSVTTAVNTADMERIRQQGETARAQILAELEAERARTGNSPQTQELQNRMRELDFALAEARARASQGQGSQSGLLMGLGLAAAMGLGFVLVTRD